MHGRVIFRQPLLNGVTHDVAESLPGTGGDFKKTFILNDPQQGSEILCFQAGDGPVTNRREDMVFHTGKNTVGIISRPFFIGFVPFQCRRSEAFFRACHGFFRRTLLCGIDILRQQFTNGITLLTGISQGNLRVGTRSNTGFFL